MTARCFSIGEFTNKQAVSGSRFVCGFNNAPTLNSDGEYQMGGFNYRGFDSIDAFEKFSKNHNNVAQVIRFPMRFLYFDFDKLALTPNDVLPFVKDFLVSLGKKINKELELKYFQIHTKTKNDKIVSFHLISFEYAMNMSQMEDLVSDVNNEFADDCVYKKDRLFFNCYNGKVNKNLFEYDKRFNQTDYKLIWIDDTKDKNIVVLTYKRPQSEAFISTDDPLQFLIENKDKYLKQSRYWKLLMSIVKRDALMSKTDFCIQSLIDPYTLKQNMSAWDEENFATKDTMEYAFRKITKVQMTPKIFNQEFFDYVGTLTDAQKTYFTTAENDHTKVKFKIDNISFNKKTGILTNGDKVSLYYYDKSYAHQRLNEENFNNINRENELTQLIDDFKNKKRMNLFVKALYGVGKTHLMLKPIIEWAKQSGYTLIFLTENNTLNRQIAHKHSLASHLDKIAVGVPQDYVITSVESIRKYRKRYDIVIVDECISLLAHFTSKKTFKNNSGYECFQAMMTILNNSTQKVFCDADLTFTKYKDFFNNFKSHDTELITRITFNPYTDSSFKLWTTDFDWIHQVKQNGKRIAMPCNTSGSCRAIRGDCIANKLNYLIITGDGINLNSDILITDAVEIANIKTNIVKLLHEHQIQVFAYSPSISTGFSLDEAYFHRIYAVIKTYNDGIVSRGFIQMLMRCRRLIDKEFNIRITPTKRVKQFVKIGDTRLALQQDEIAFYKNTENTHQLRSTDIHTDTMLEATAERINNDQFVYVMYSYFMDYGFNVEIITECENSSVVNSSGNKIEDLYCLETSNEEILDLLDFIRFDKSSRLNDILQCVLYDNFDEAILMLGKFVLPKALKIKELLCEEPPQKEEAILLLTNNEICDRHTHLLFDMVRRFIRADERQLTYGYYDIDFFLGLKQTTTLKEFSRLYRFHDNVYSKISKMLCGKLLNTEYIKTAFDARDHNEIFYVKSLYEKITSVVDKNGIVVFDDLKFDDNDIINFNLYKSDKTKKAFDSNTPIACMITHANKLIKSYYGMEIDMDKRPTKKSSFRMIKNFIPPPFEKYKFPANKCDGYIDETKLELNVKRNCDEFKTYKRTNNPHGFTNKYGTTHPKRLSDIYDAPKKLAVYRDYQINPNNSTRELCKRIMPSPFDVDIYSEEPTDTRTICENMLSEIICSVADGEIQADKIKQLNIESETHKIKHKNQFNSPRFFDGEQKIGKDLVGGLRVRFPTPIV